MTERVNFEARLVDNVSGPARKAGRAIEQLGRQTKSAGALSIGETKGSGRASKVIREQREEMARFAGESKRSALSIASDFSIVADFALRAASAVGQIAIRAGSATIEMASFAQNSELAFNQLAKHGTSGIELFDHARGIAEQFGLDVEATTDSYIKLLSLQFNPQQADDLVKMGADMRVLKASADDVKGILLAIGQIKSKGRLQAEELLQLQERNISGELVQEALMKALDIDKAELQKRMQAGKVGAEDAIAAIQEAVKKKLGEDNLGEAGQKFADTTIDGVLGRFKAKGQNLGIGLGQRVAEGLTKVGGKALERFDAFISSPEGEKAMDRLGERIVYVASVIEASIPKIEAFIGGFGEGASEAADAFGELSGALDIGDADNFRDIGKAIGTIAVSIGALTAGAVMLIDPIYKVGKALATAIVEPFVDTFFRFYDAWNNIQTLFDDQGMTLGQKAYEIGKETLTAIGGGIVEMALYPIDVTLRFVDNLLEAFDVGEGIRQVGRDLMIGLGEGIMDSLLFPLEAAGKAGDAVIAKFKETFDSHSPSKRTHREGGFLSIGLGGGIEDKAPYAEARAERTGERTIESFSLGLDSKSAGLFAAEGGFDFSFGAGTGAAVSLGSDARGDVPGPLRRHRSMEYRSPSRREFDEDAWSRPASTPAPDDDFSYGPRTSAASPIPQADAVGFGGGDISIGFGDIYVNGENAAEVSRDLRAQIRAHIAEVFEEIEIEAN